MCCAPDCQRLIPVGMLMCGTDWRRVPREQRHAVNRAWSRWQANECSLEELRAVQMAAMEALA